MDPYKTILSIHFPRTLHVIHEQDNSMNFIITIINYLQALFSQIQYFQQSE